jgi:hypothetical protein
MSREILSSKANKHDVCEAFGCSADATTWISVKAGPHRLLNLHLCNHCIGKFEWEECK